MSLISDNMLADFYYTLATKGFITAAKIISPINARAKALIDSRKTEINPPVKIKNETRLWLHVASLGEFEQARPVLEILKQEIPNLKIFTSFFSPSGYESRHSDSLIDFAFYLPFESKNIAKSLVLKINPDFAIWVKYDFWIHYLNELHKNRIPVFLIAAQFRDNQIYFKKNGKNFINTFKNFTSIICQNDSSGEILSKNGINQYIICGDPRIDRVIKGKANNKQFKLIEKFKGHNQLLIIGSAYKKEIEIIQEYLKINPDLKCIIAPHFVDHDTIKQFNKLLPGAVPYSSYEKNQNIETQILIIDSIGKLSSLYQYANYAFIGGGFKSGGLHNILEAIVYGIPVCFGPKISRFPEAVQLVELKLADIVKTDSDFQNWIQSLIENKIKQENRHQNLEDWILANSGAASRTTAEILKKLK